MIHYRETREVKQRRLGSKAPFRDGARCGNGAPVERLENTTDPDKVTCLDCKRLIGR